MREGTDYRLQDRGFSRASSKARVFQSSTQFVSFGRQYFLMRLLKRYQQLQYVMFFCFRIAVQLYIHAFFEILTRKVVQWSRNDLPCFLKF